MKKTVLAILAWSITICVYAQNKIYWVEETPNLTKVKKAGLNGAAPQDVLVSGIKYPNGLDIDPAGGKLYWSEGSGAIRRANLDGSGTETLLLSSGSTGKLKLDIPSGYIYFIDDETQLHRVDLDGANPTQLTTGLDLLTGWDIDPLSEKLYWFDIGTNNLLRANLDGSTQEILISDPTLFVGSLTLDLNQSKIYMTGGNGEILRSNLDGSQSVELIPAGGGCPQQLAVDVPNGHLYWTDECSSSIHRADLDGQNALPLITTGLALPGIIRQDATSLYWIDAGTQAIRRANLNGSNVETLLQAEFTAPGGAAYDPVNDKLYLTDAALGIIRRCNPDGSNCEVVIPYGSGLNNPRGIALDIADGKIYWSERHNSPLIRRANLDGSNMEDLVTENDAPLKQVFSIALDPVNGKIYWADLGNGLTDGRIQRADMSGGNVETLFSGDRYAALTLGGDKMYWSIVGANRKLQRANLDGSNPEDLVTTGFGGARGIAIDPVNRKLVWNDLVSDELKRCNLDGSNIETILSGVHTLVLAIGTQINESLCNECAAQAGYLINNAAVPGLLPWTAGTDLTDASTGNEVVFQPTYFETGIPEPGPEYDYALLLINRANQKIVAYNIDSDPDFGNFDFSVLPGGTYQVYGISYSHCNLPASAEDYLISIVAAGHPDDLAIIHADAVPGGSFCMEIVNRVYTYHTATVSSEPLRIFGDVLKYDGSPLQDVNVIIEGNVYVNQLNQPDGSYEVEDIPYGILAVISAEKAIELAPPPITVTIADLVRLRKWILQIESPTSVCEVAAYDMNGSSAISTFDQVLMSRAIRGEPVNPKWNILPAEVYASLPQLGYEDEHIIDHLSVDTEADFIAVWPGAVQTCSTPVLQPAFVTVSPQAPATPGCLCDLVEVPVTANNFTDLLGLQLSMEWDPAALEFQSVIPGANFLDAAFSLDLAQVRATGRLAFVWVDFTLATHTYGPDEELFRLVFRVVGTGNSAIRVSNIPTQAFALDALEQLSPLLTQDAVFQGAACAGSSNLACYDDIQVSLANDCQAPLTIAMVLEGDLGCLTAADFTITVNDAIPGNGNIVDGEGTFIYTVAPSPLALALGFTGCWGSVTTEDHSPPVAICRNRTLQAAPDYTLTVTAAQFDNGSTDNCGIASMTLSQTEFSGCSIAYSQHELTLTVTDVNGFTATCLANLNINPPPNDPPHNYRIRFPADVAALADCAELELPLEMDENCALLAIAYDDEMILPTGGECLKIFRRIRVINWLEYDGFSPPVVIGRDENCNGQQGEQDVWLIVRPNGQAYLDADGDETNSFPAAGVKGNTCDGLTNPAGYWMRTADGPGATPPRNLTSVGYWEYHQVINVEGTAGPTITVPFVGGPFCVNDPQQCSGDANFSFYVEHLCTPNNYQIELLFDEDNDGTGVVLLDNNLVLSGSLPYFTVSSAFPEGQHALEIRVTNGCGGVRSEVLLFQVVSCGVIAIECPAPLSIELTGIVCETPIPDLSGQISLTCGQYDVYEQTPAVGTVVGLGVHPITVTVHTADYSYSATCSTELTVIEDIDLPSGTLCQNATIPLGASGTATLDGQQLVNPSALSCGTTIGLNPNTVSCNEVTTIPAPRQNHALSFDGINEMVTFASPISGTGNYTVEAWFRSENIGTCGPLNSYKRVFGWSTTSLELADCGGTLLVRDGSTWKSTNVNVRDNNWHHAACVREGNRHIVYVDGQKVLDYQKTPAVISSAVYVGRGANSSGFWKGQIDEFRIWNVARSHGDIVAWKDKPLPAGPTGLAGYWNFDGGPGSPNVVSAIGGGTGTMANMEPASDWVGGAPLNYTPPLPVDVTLTSGVTTGNCTAFVTVTDTEVPVLNCLSSYTVAPNTTILLPNLLIGAPADNCGIAWTGLSKDRFTCAETGAQNVTVTAVDLYGNTANCVVPVLVEDGFQFVCNDKNLTLDVSGVAVLTTADVVTLMPSVCGSYFPSLSQNFFDCTNIGTNLVTVNISNGQSCQVTVTVTDATPPAVTCQNISLSLDANGDATLLPAQVLSGATDACGIGNLSLSRINFSCADLGSPTFVTLTATDVNGNWTTCTATVTVADPIPPTLNCQDFTLYLNASGQASITPSLVSSTITDNCAVLSTNLSQSVFDCTLIEEPPTNYALNFSGGPNAYLAFASALNGFGNFTLETWFKDETSGTTPRYLVSWQGSVLELADLNGSLFVRFGSSSALIPAPLRNGAWHHLAVVRNGTNVAIYLNGVSIWSGSYNFALGPNFQIGRRYSTTSTSQGPWIGKVDEVRFWNTARTALQLQGAMNAPLQGTPTGLIGYWPMNDGPGLTIAADASVNNNHGVLSGIMNPSTAWVSGAPLQPSATVVPVTLTAMDIAGNSSACTVSATIVSGPNPCCPAPVAQCQNISIPLGPSGAVTITAAQVDNGSSADCGIQSMSVSPNTFTCANAGVQTVTLTVTDNNGVSTTCTAQVTLLGKPDIQTSSAPVVCEGGAFDLATLNIAENTGASFALSYHSDTPANAGNELAATDVSPVATTTYYILATSATTGCTDELPVVITVNPTPNDLDIYLYDTPVICTGESYSLCSIGILAGPTSALSAYSWHSDEPATPGNQINDCDVSPSVNQTYYALLTDGNSCTVTRSFDLVVNTGPDLSVNTPAPICAGESVNLATLTVTDANNTSAVLTYHSDSPATSGNQLPSTTVTPVATTTYNLLATASNGCKDEAAINLVVNASVPQAFCRNVTVQLGGDGTYTLSPEQVDDGSFATCGSVTLSVSPNVFTCDNLGNNTVTLTVMAPGGVTESCTAEVIVEAVGPRLFGTALGPQSGTVFSMGTDGSEFDALKVFDIPPQRPYATLVIGGDGFLYGTSKDGGPFEGGTVFRLQLDGTGIEVLHSFNGTNGADPYAGLTIDANGWMYGTTYSGGLANKGTVFRLQTDGTGFEVLHSFDDINGSYPYARLIVGSDGLLYGTTSFGGTVGRGNVFRLQTDGTGFEVLHSFDGDGAYPYTGLIFGSDGLLYGTTIGGGIYSYGVVYRLQTDGTDFEMLHSFDGLNGASPQSGLTFGADGLLYGTTRNGGGGSFEGTLYRLQTDGTGFEVLHFFDHTNGASPRAELTFGVDGRLYGTTIDGGSSNSGTIYRLQTDGIGFEVLHSFDGINGASPHSGVTFGVDGRLYGMTRYGGGSMDGGTIYRLQTDGTGFELLNFTNGHSPYAALISGTDGFLYGTTVLSGNLDYGTVFRVRKGGTDFQVLHSFNNTNGAYPHAGLILDINGWLYGTTNNGGSSGNGSVFRLQTDGTGFEILHSFDDYTNGTYPYAGLILSPDGWLYGTTSSGGSYNRGTVFRLHPDGTGFEVLHAFDYTFSTTPYAGLTLDASGWLYGTTSSRGRFGIAGDSGKIFRLQTDGTNFEVLHSFNYTNGANPEGGLILNDGGWLYGTTSSGGNFSRGTVFRIQTDGTDFVVLHSFDYYTNGAYPYAGLTFAAGGFLYGNTTYGGNFYYGTVYRLQLDGTNFEVIRHFDGTDASNSNASLLYLPGYDCPDGFNAPQPGSQAVQAAGNLAFYPNPTTGKLYIRMGAEAEKTATIEVFNNLGQQVLAQQMEATAGSVGVLELGRFENGVYIVRVSVPGQAPVSERVVLNRP